MVEETNPDYFGAWCEITTIGGVVDWYQANRIGKIFWFIVIFILFVLTVWQNKDGTADYFSDDNFYQTSASIETRSGTLFPNVTICNFNRAILSKTFNISDKALSYAFGSFPMVYDIQMNWFNITEYEDEWQKFIQQNPEMADLTILMKAIGNDCKRTFLQCTFSGMEFECCDRVIEVVNSYGKCFTISPPPPSGGESENAMQTVPGSSDGLKLILLPHLDEYRPDLFVNNLLESGFIASIGYVYEPHIPQPLTLGVGTHTWIALSAQLETISKPQIQIHDLPCRQDPELKILAVQYSKSNCFFDCTLQVTLKTCGCLPYSDFQKPYPVCNASFVTTCSTMSLTPAAKLNVKNCRQDCLISCDDTMSITSKVSMTKYPFQNLTSVITNVLQYVGYPDLTEDDIASASSVDIYFPQLELLNIETAEVMSIFTYIANVGGNLGLWLGISITTGLQIIYQIAEYLVQKYRAPKAKPIKRCTNEMF